MTTPRGRPEPAGEPPSRPAPAKSVVREYVEAIVIAVLLALVIRTFVVQAFTIPSGSMMDTLLVGDYILVNKFLFGPEMPLTDYRLPGLRDPHRGDIIVFKYPQDEKRDFIKRIVATAGRDGPGARPAGAHQRPAPRGALRAAQPRRAQPHGVRRLLRLRLRLRAARRPRRLLLRDGRQPRQLPGRRYWGFVKRDKIKGKAFLIYWSWDGDRHWLRWWRLGRYIP